MPIEVSFIFHIIFAIAILQNVALAQSVTTATPASPAVEETSVTTPAASALEYPGAGASGCAAVSTLSAQYLSYNPSRKIPRIAWVSCQELIIMI